MKRTITLIILSIFLLSLVSAELRVYVGNPQMTFNNPETTIIPNYIELSNKNDFSINIEIAFPENVTFFENNISMLPGENVSIDYAIMLNDDKQNVTFTIPVTFNGENQSFTVPQTIIVKYFNDTVINTTNHTQQNNSVPNSGGGTSASVGVSDSVSVTYINNSHNVTTSVSNESITTLTTEASDTQDTNSSVDETYTPEYPIVNWLTVTVFTIIVILVIAYLIYHFRKKKRLEKEQDEKLRENEREVNNSEFFDEKEEPNESDKSIN